MFGGFFLGPAMIYKVLPKNYAKIHIKEGPNKILNRDSAVKKSNGTIRDEPGEIGISKIVKNNDHGNENDSRKNKAPFN